MRILHTSDWHLGRTLHGVDLLSHQAAHLDHLVEVVRSEQVGAVVVAGDVYDRAIPPVEAVTLLGEALARLAEHTTVVVTPGNHDSAIRLGFGAGLMRPEVHLRTTIAGLGRPVEVADRAGGDPLLVYPLPYLDPDATRFALADGDPCAVEGRLPRSHEAVTGAAMRRVRADLAARRAAQGRPLRSLVVAHAFVVGGAPSESERDIRVGGVDSVPAGVFAGTDYVALGHLHGPQRVPFAAGAAGAVAPGESGGREPVLQYSGSPLAFSFGERHQRKASVLVEIGPDGVVGEPELVEAPVPRRLTELSGRLEDLLGAAGEAYTRDWVKAVVTDPARPADLYARLRARFEHLLVVEHRPEGGRLAGAAAAAVTSSSDPLAVLADFVAHVSGSAPSAAEAEVLRRAYEDVLAAERSA